MKKPDCDCWRDPQQRAAREMTCDTLGQDTIQSFLSMVATLNLCPASVPYTAAAVVTGVVYAAMLVEHRADGSPEKCMVKAEEIMDLVRERIRGDRQMDLDRMVPVSEARN